jgi:arylsulfatase A-like enzyme
MMPALKKKRKVIVGSLAALVAFLMILIFTWVTAAVPHIIIIVMDTARQDHLSCYGYRRDTTPNLTALAEESKIYYNAYSTSSWTNPAHASLFTGLYPLAHKTTQENWRMSHQVTSLAAVLKENGYDTCGIVENPMLGKHNNFNQGFARYYETWRKEIESSGGNAAFFLFKKYLEERDAKTPFFMFINFIEPHSPYNSARQFCNQFVSDPSITCVSNLWRKHYLGWKIFSDDELQHLRELYDAELLYVDYLIGDIVDELKRNHLWHNTVFIVTSDHGENIGDHGHMDHVFSLYESTIKIPLIIHYPKLFSPGSGDYDVTQLTDIFPTVIGLAGIDSGKYPSQGFDLLGNDSRKERPVFTEYYYPRQALEAFPEKDRSSPNLATYKRMIRSIAYGNKKLIWGSDGRHELYDLTVDQYEENNLIEKDGEAVQEMLNRLEVVLKSYGKDDEQFSDKESGTLDTETAQALESLGYLQ